MSNRSRFAGTLRRVFRPRVCGPGLPEACFWTLAVLVSQAACALSVAALVLWCSGGWPSDEATWGAAIESLLEPPYPSILIGCGALLPVLVGVPAVVTRCGRGWREKLSLRTPRADLVLLALGATLPLTVVSAALHDAANGWWQSLVTARPELAGLPTQDAMGVVRGQFAGGSLWLLVATVALGPALIEEFVFRGLIGRGLTARWGVPAGVLLTTVLFAAVHLSPPYAVAVIPLGLFLHVAYLATRSLKAVIGLHFANNLFAAAAARWGLGSGLDVAPPLVLISLGTVVGIAGLLWEFRDRPATAGRTQAVTGTALGGFTVLFVTAAL